MNTTCPGSKQTVGYSPADVTTLSPATGLASRAQGRCPKCGKVLTGRIVRTESGISLGGHGMVVIPAHTSPRKA